MLGHRRSVHLVVVAKLLLIGCAQDERERPSEPAAADLATVSDAARELDEALTRWEAFGFSGALLLARRGEVLLSRGYGVANREKATPVTSRTLFDVGSLSKQFTAAAILRLAEANRLDVEESIALLLPHVPLDKRPITVHHLLTHTSGISDFGDDSQPVSRDELVREILRRPLARSPGTAYEYSNLGYTLLAALVEVASGGSFEEYLSRELFSRAGMEDTGFAWAPPASSKDRLALGYGAFIHPCAGEDPRRRVASWRGRGSGNVLSTVEDLLAWDRALAEGRVLNDESRAAMFTGHTPAEADFLQYGYGWRLQRTGEGGSLTWHSGLDGAYSAMFRRYTEEDLVLVFLSNLSVGGVPMRDVLVPPARSGPTAAAPMYGVDAAAAPAHTRSTPPSPDGFADDYRVGTAGRWRVRVEDGVYSLRAEGQEAVDALFPPPDAAARERARDAGDQAREIARLLLSEALPDDPRLDRIDPLGYAERDAATIARSWRSLRGRPGSPADVRVLGTTGLRSRFPAQMVTWLRLGFAEGVLDEHLIWFSDDELYLLPCAPSSFEVRLLPRPKSDGLVGFDLVSKRDFQARLVDDSPGIEISTGDHVHRGARIQTNDNDRPSELRTTL